MSHKQRKHSLRTKEIEVALKVERIIQSCQTPEHLRVAEKVLKGALKWLGWNSIYQSDFSRQLCRALKDTFAMKKPELERM